MAVKLSALLTGRALLLRKKYFSASDNYAYYRLSKLQGLVRPEELGKLKKLIYRIGSQTRHFPASGTET
jgi:hypothetical protein